MMRILFLGDAGTTNTQSYAGWFANRGHSVGLISLHQPLSTSGDYQTWYLPCRRKAEYPLKWREARSIAERWRPDVVVSYRLTSYGLLGALIGLRPVVATATGFDVLWETPGSTWIRRTLVSLVASRADLLIFWSDHMRRAAGVPHEPGRVMVMPRGIDLGLFTPGSAVPGRGPTIITTRSLKPQYRPEVLIQAVPMIAAEIPDARLVVLGYGPEEEPLRRLAGSLGVAERVEFRGKTGYAEVARELRQAAVYVSAVGFDGVSASLLEAMACSVYPVVVDNEANRQWIVPGRNGSLYPEGDVATLAREVVRALKDPSWRERATAESLRRVTQRGSLQANMSAIESRMMRLAGMATGVR